MDPPRLAECACYTHGVAYGEARGRTVQHAWVSLRHTVGSVVAHRVRRTGRGAAGVMRRGELRAGHDVERDGDRAGAGPARQQAVGARLAAGGAGDGARLRSEEHTSELQS